MSFFRRYTAEAEPSPPILRDAAGNDFKRLIHKSRNKQVNGFAVGEPIILPLPPNYKRRAPGMLDKVYDWLFTHEDRYFNDDRSELSKDIFPANDYRNSVQVFEERAFCVV